MFEQTFVDVTGATRRPHMLALSSLAQACVLGVLVLIPLFYTQVLPVVQLRSLLAAPAPPQAPASTPPHVIVKTQGRTALAPRIFNLMAVPLPQPITKQSEVFAAAPPDVGAGIGPGVDGGLPLVSNVLPEAAPAAIKKEPAKPMRIGGSVSEANLIHRVPPVYPPIASRARVEGIVEFTATISKEGIIEHLQLVHGHPLLVKAAEEAILQWRYRPTLLNGEPVEVITDIIVKFTLNQR